MLISDARGGRLGEGWGGEECTSHVTGCPIGVGVGDGDLVAVAVGEGEECEEGQGGEELGEHCGVN